jgi:hypothetical protein
LQFTQQAAQISMRKWTSRISLGRPSRRNRRGGILVHPRHKNPDRPFQLRGKSLAVRFSDRALRTVGSAFCPYSHGPNRSFSDSPRTLTYPTDLWACFERGPVISDLGYVVVRWCMRQMSGAVVPPWFCSFSRGKIDFSCPHSSCSSKIVRPWRPAMRRRVRSLHRVVVGSEAHSSQVPSNPILSRSSPPFLSSLPWCGGGQLQIG